MERGGNIVIGFRDALSNWYSDFSWHNAVFCYICNTSRKSISHAMRILSVSDPTGFDIGRLKGGNSSFLIHITHRSVIVLSPPHFNGEICDRVASLFKYGFPSGEITLLRRQICGNFTVAEARGILSLLF